MSADTTTETRDLITRVRADIAPADQPQALYDLARTADGDPLVDAEMLRREADRCPRCAGEGTYEADSTGEEVECGTCRGAGTLTPSEYERERERARRALEQRIESAEAWWLDAFPEAAKALERIKEYKRRLEPERARPVPSPRHAALVLGPFRLSYEKGVLTVSSKYDVEIRPRGFNEIEIAEVGSRS